MSSWGNNDNAANAPYWAVNSTIAHGGAPATPTAANVALLYGNTAPDVYTTDKTIGLFMIDTAEIVAGSDNVVGVSIVNKGSGYLETPSVSFSGGGGSSAAATATISGGKVTKVAVTNGGSSYETVPSVNIDVPRRTIAMSAANTTSNTITYTSHGLSTNNVIKYYSNGGTAMAGLTNATSYYAIKVNNNSFKVAAAAGGAEIDITGTGNDNQYFDLLSETTATAVAEKGLGADGDGNGSSERAVHTGWNLKTTGSGGRAGRVQIETLVAISEVKGDGSDDLSAPDA